MKTMLVVLTVLFLTSCYSEHVRTVASKSYERKTLVWDDTIRYVDVYTVRFQSRGDRGSSRNNSVNVSSNVYDAIEVGKVYYFQIRYFLVDTFD